MLLPESGYTPANLAAVIEQSRLTRDQVCTILHTDARTLRRWLAAEDVASRADMPLRRWRQLLSEVNRATIG